MDSSKSRINLAPDEVQVWTFGLDLPPAELAEFTEFLSESERKRAMRFHFERHRNRFIAGRGFLRQALGGYLRAEPGSIEFSYGSFGKPQIAGNASDSGLHFNLAHCENLAVLAVTRAGTVGVDVEHVRLLEDASELVARFFSPRENAAFQQVSEEQKPLAFFNLWTRKEAWLKATGEGIGSSLHLVEVSFLPGQPARLLTIPAELGGDLPWTIEEFVPDQDFVAAVAVAAETIQLRCSKWSPV